MVRCSTLTRTERPATSALARSPRAARTRALHSSILVPPSAATRHRSYAGSPRWRSSSPVMTEKPRAASSRPTHSSTWARSLVAGPRPDEADVAGRLGVPATPGGVEQQQGRLGATRGHGARPPPERRRASLGPQRREGLVRRGSGAREDPVQVEQPEVAVPQRRGVLERRAVGERVDQLPPVPRRARPAPGSRGRAARARRRRRSRDRARGSGRGRPP